MTTGTTSFGTTSFGTDSSTSNAPISGTMVSSTTSTNITDVVVVFVNGVIIPTNTYSIVGNTITFATAPALNSRIVVKTFGNNTSGILGFFARSYSGGLFGIHELPTYRLPLRQELYEKYIISDQLLEEMFKELSRYNLPSTSLDFYTRINSRLEKALFILYNYAIYSSIQQ